jgi:glutamate-1-semialdehyde aminotransferase
VSGDASLFQLVPTAAELVNYRSIPRDAAANAWMDKFHRELLLAGAIISHRGLSCLSSAMTEADVDEVLGAFEMAAERVAAN